MEEGVLDEQGVESDEGTGEEGLLVEGAGTGGTKALTVCSCPATKIGLGPWQGAVDVCCNSVCSRFDRGAGGTAGGRRGGGKKDEVEDGSRSKNELGTAESVMTGSTKAEGVGVVEGEERAKGFVWFLVSTVLKHCVVFACGEGSVPSVGTAFDLP